EVSVFLNGTFLENVPILAVSGVTGEGLSDFYEGLKILVNGIEPKSTEGIFRLPIERAFSLKGFGTVVTGIPVSGSVKVGEEVILLPQKIKSRIKAIQVYGKDSDTALCGQCAALNVPQLDYKTIVRGNVAAVGDYFEPQYWYLCKIKLLESCKTTIKHASRLNFHTGASKVSGTVYLLESNSISAGKEALGQIKLSEPITAGPGDRFILRSMSPAHTIGGGMIIEGISHKLQRRRDDVSDAQNRAKAILNNQSFIEYCILNAESYSVKTEQLCHRVKLPPELLKRYLSKLIEDGKIIELSSNLYVHSNMIAKIKEQLLQIVSQFHKEHPESPGISYNELLKSSGLHKEVFDGIMNLILSEARIVKRKGLFALAEHREKFSDKEKELLKTIEEFYIDRLFNPPMVNEVIEKTKTDAEAIKKALHILLEQQILVKVEKDICFHQKAIEKAEGLLREYIQKEGCLESVKFKYLLDTTRKYAIPLLDHFDKAGITRRVGYTRYLKEKE
ncbi:MAG: SelB domain-containing protein, partial [Planctomycetota bacterium]